MIKMTQSNDNKIGFAFERLSLDPEPNDKNKSKFILTKKVFEAIDILRNKKRNALIRNPFMNQLKRITIYH